MRDPPYRPTRSSVDIPSASLGMMPVAALVLLRAAGVRGARRLRASAAPLIVCGIVLSVSWIGVNASTERSISRFKHSIAYDRTNVGYAYETLAKTYSSLSRLPDAIDAMEGACAESWNPRRMVVLGGMKYRQGDVVGALDAYRAVIERSPQYSLARERLVTVLVEGREWEELAVVSQGGTDLFPDNPFFFYYLGQALNEMGREEEGQAAIKRSQLLRLRRPKQ